MKKKAISLLLLIFGIILIIDGAGSIIVYFSQPWFPDHSIRILRAVIGFIIIWVSDYKLR